MSSSLPKYLACLFVTAALVVGAAFPARAADRDPFAEGSGRASILVGNGYAFDESYLIVGVGVGYFFARGLELGVDAESWTSGTPRIFKISPELRYVLPTGGPVRPYVGAFYRRTMIEDRNDLNSLGGRAGVYFVSGQGSYFGLGGVYEQYLSCNSLRYRSCSETYPEIIFAIAF